jgi:hypothetical protein
VPVTVTRRVVGVFVRFRALHLSIDERSTIILCDSQFSRKNKNIAQSKSVVSNTGKNIAE